MDSRLQLENSVNNIGKTTTVEDSKNKTGYLPASTTSSRPRWVELRCWSHAGRIQTAGQAESAGDQRPESVPRAAGPGSCASRGLPREPLRAG